MLTVHLFLSVRGCLASRKGWLAMQGQRRRGPLGARLTAMCAWRSLSPISLGALGWLRSTSWLAGSTLKWCLQGGGTRRSRCRGRARRAARSPAHAATQLPLRKMVRPQQTSWQPHSGSASTTLPSGTGSVVWPTLARACRGKLLDAAMRGGTRRHAPMLSRCASGRSQGAATSGGAKQEC